MNTGWICPGCGRCYSPAMAACSQCSGRIVPAVSADSGQLAVRVGKDRKQTCREVEFSLEQSGDMVLLNAKGLGDRNEWSYTIATVSATGIGIIRNIPGSVGVAVDDGGYARVRFE